MRRLIILVLLCPPLWATPPQPGSSFFVENLGQWDATFAFKYDGNGATYFLTPTGFTLDLHQFDKPALTARRGGSPEPPGLGRRRRGDSGESPPRIVRGHVLRLSYVNSNPTPQLIGEDKLSSYSNYFLSRDSCKWRSRVGHYRSVIAKDVWPGIDVEYLVGAHGCAPSDGVETVYHVNPFANPSLIQLRYEGQQSALAVDANGSLLLQTSIGTVKEQAPFAYQDINDVQTEIRCRYELSGQGIYHLVLGPYDATREVVIDPTLVYSTMWGEGLGAEITSVVADTSNNPVVAGGTMSRNFPTTPGAYQEQWIGNYGFITKFAADGHSLAFSTYFPGDIRRLLLDTDQSLVIVAADVQQDWPVTANGFDTTYNGGLNDIGLAELSADGTQLRWGSYWGGDGSDSPTGEDLSADGVLYVEFETSSDDIPLTPGALYSTPESTSAYGISVFDLRHMTVLYSTYFHCGLFNSGGASGAGVRCLPGGVVWIWGPSNSTVGLDVTPDALYPSYAAEYGAFFARIRLSPPALEYASYFGNQIEGSHDELMTLIPLDNNQLLVAGETGINHGFTMPPGGFQPVPDSGFSLFLIKITLPSTLTAGTFLGGSGDEFVTSGVAVDETGSVVVTGSTRSNNFPLTADAFQAHHYPGQDMAGEDAFLSRLSPDFSTLRYSTYFGGADWDATSGIALRDLSHVWICGDTYSLDFPQTPDAIGYQGGWGSAWVSRFDLSGLSVTSPSPPFVPQNLGLRAYPNPFNPTTTIAFTLPRAERVKLTVFDLLGREVFAQPCAATNGMLSAGEHRVTFDGSGLSSGAYFARLQTPQASRIQKLLLLR